MSSPWLDAAWPPAKKAKLNHNPEKKIANVIEWLDSKDPKPPVMFITKTSNITLGDSSSNFPTLPN